MIDYTTCSNQHIELSDTNYRQVLNYFRHCYMLAYSLVEPDRANYLSRLDSLLQESWYDFIWQTDLSSEELIWMEAVKENLLNTSSLVAEARQGSYPDRYPENSMPLDRSISYIVLILLGVTILVLAMKLLLQQYTKMQRARRFKEDCESEMDVRMINEQPPTISPPSSEEHYVFYETHFLYCNHDNPKRICSVPTEVHIKKCCSQDNCRMAPELILKKCRTHQSSSGTKNSGKYVTGRYCRNLQERKQKVKTVCVQVSSCLNQINEGLCLCRPVKSPDISLTSSGVSLNEDVVPFYKAVRKLRLENGKPSNRR